MSKYKVTPGPLRPLWVVRFYGWLLLSALGGVLTSNLQWVPLPPQVAAYWIFLIHNLEKASLLQNFQQLGTSCRAEPKFLFWHRDLHHVASTDLSNWTPHNPGKVPSALESILLSLVCRALALLLGTWIHWEVGSEAQAEGSEGICCRDKIAPGTHFMRLILEETRQWPPSQVFARAMSYDPHSNSMR